MANYKISQLPTASTFTSDDLLPIVDGATLTTQRATGQQILNFITGSTFDKLSVNNLTASNITASTANITTVSSSDLIISGGSVTLEDSAYITYQPVPIDKLVMFPGLHVSGSTSVSGDLVVEGKLTAQEYYTEVVSASIIYESGSTKFGNDSADTHQFSGSVLISGTLSTSIVSASSYIGINTGSSPGGPDQSIQFNSGSSLSGTSQLVYDYTSNTLSGTTAQFTNLTASSLQVEGTSIFSGSMLLYGSASLSVNPTAAYLLYSSSVDKIVVYPGLHVSGGIFVGGSSIYGNVAELTASTGDYTLVATDSGKFLNVNSGSNVNLTVPAGLPTGFTISVCQIGCGLIVFTTGSGVTLNNRQGHTKTAGQYAVASIVGTAADTYILTGDTTT